MTLLRKVVIIACAAILLSAAFTMLSVPSAAQVCTNKVISIVDYRPQSTTVGTSVYLQIVLQGSCDWSDGSHTSGFEDGAYVTFTADGTQFGPYMTGANGVATGPLVSWSSPGSKSFTVYVVDDQNNQHKTIGPIAFPVSVSGGATPTLQVTPKVTPIVTIIPPVATLVPQVQPPTVVYPPTTVINQYFPGSVTTGTNPATGDPAIQVTNQPSSTKLQTTLIDFASNPAKNTENYNQSVQNALNNGYTLTAKGERTYNDPSQDYRYARFTKDRNTLSLQAIGNNSTNRMEGIPGDILLSQTDETFDTGGLFGLSQLVTWALIIVVAIAVIAIIVGLFWYRRSGRDENQSLPQQYQK